jgi:hypothetical protein
MKNFINVQKLEDLKRNNVSCAELCQIPLLHGTRRYALQTTKEEREKFYSACNIVMDFAKKIAYSDIITEESIEEYQRQQNPRFYNVLVYAKGINKFTYGEFYVTTSYSSAVSFAHNVGGELGDTAYAQCVGLLHFNVELDDTVSEAVKIVMEEYKKYVNSEKVILAFYGVRFTDLTREGGSEFLIDSTDPEDIEYNRVLIDKLNNSADTDTMTRNNNFILSNIEEYTGYVISEKLFKDGFSVFTKIIDVDKKIRYHNLCSRPKWEF